jgi:hypothetical protein
LNTISNIHKKGAGGGLYDIGRGAIPPDYMKEGGGGGPVNQYETGM